MEIPGSIAVFLSRRGVRDFGVTITSGEDLFLKRGNATGFLYFSHGRFVCTQALHGFGGLQVLEIIKGGRAKCKILIGIRMG